MRNTANRNNRFAPLSQMLDAQETEDIVELQQEQPPRSVRMPPITIIEKSLTEIKNILAGLQVTEYHIKNTNIGTKLCSLSEENYKKVFDKLDQDKVRFFTHDQSARQNLKIVLTGLHKVTTTELKTELETNGITCSEVKDMTIRKPRYQNHATYLLTFPKGTTKLSVIRQKGRVLFHTIVYYAYYEKKQRGPVRCYNCQTFGHGSLGCHLKTVCGLCAGEHNSAQCPIKDNKEATKACANCLGNHPASYIDCPSRAEYLNLKRNLQQRTSRRNYHQIPTRAPEMSSTNFPQMPTRRPQPMNSTPPGFQRQNNVQQQSSFANVARVGANANNLFSYSEIMNITNDLLSKLKNCRSKEEQFRVITELTVKYLYDSFP